MSTYVTTSDLVGKTFIKVEQVRDDELRFYLTDTSYYCYYHEQNCCESVYIEDVVGDWRDLIGISMVLVNHSRMAHLIIGIIGKNQKQFGARPFKILQL